MKMLKVSEVRNAVLNLLLLTLVFSLGNFLEFLREVSYEIFNILIYAYFQKIPVLTWIMDRNV